MKRNRSIKLITILAPIFLTLGLFFVGASNAEAACTVLPPELRTTKPAPNQYGTNDFYQESNRPFIYIDIHTQGCDGTQVKSFSLLGNTNYLLVPDTVAALRDYQIVPGGPMLGGPVNGANFTIAMQAGEEKCDGSCAYTLQVDGQDVGGAFIQYECDGVCLTGNWNFFGVHPLGSDLGGAGGPDQYGSVGILGGFQGGGSNPGNNSSTSSSTQSSEASSSIAIHIVNPLAGTVDTIPQFFQKIVNIIIKIAIPIVAMAIVYSGLLFVVARGDPAQLEKAKQAFTFAVIGGIILLASWLIAEAIKDALTSLAYII